MDTSIALALAGASLAISIAFSLVGGGIFIYIALKVVRTSDEFSKKADTALVKDYARDMSDELGKNMAVILPRITVIETKLKLTPKPNPNLNLKLKLTP